MADEEVFHVHGQDGCPYCEGAKELAAKSEGRIVYHTLTEEDQPLTQAGRDQSTIPIVELAKHKHIPGGLDALKNVSKRKRAHEDVQQKGVASRKRERDSGDDKEEEDDGSKRSRYDMTALDEALPSRKRAASNELRTPFKRPRQEDPIEIRVVRDDPDNETVMTVRPTQTIAAALDLDRDVVVVFAGEPIEDLDETTFEDLGIEDGSRLEIHLAPRATVRQFMEDLATLNGKSDEWVETMMKRVDVDAQDPSRVRSSMILHNMGLTTLPESIGDLHVRDLNLSLNNFTTLPETFGQLQVGGDLMLIRCGLTSLPESFGDLSVSGKLFLIDNPLTSLPDSISKLYVGDALYIDDLPARMLKKVGHLKVNVVV